MDMHWTIMVARGDWQARQLSCVQATQRLKLSIQTFRKAKPYLTGAPRAESTLASQTSGSAIRHAGTLTSWRG